MRISLADVVHIDLKKGEPNDGERKHPANQNIYIAGIDELAGKPWNENKYGECDDADVDQAIQPSPPIDVRQLGLGHLFPELNCDTRVKIGRYMEMTMPPTTVPSTTIIAGSMAVIRSPTAASTSSS